MKKLSEIQGLLRVPKNQFNKFGGYNFRSCEDILDAVKRVINPLGYYITLDDQIVSVGDRVYVKATATISNGEESFSVCAFAREETDKKGFDQAQISGAASSYSRKYALSGLFAIDDSRDADSYNDGTKSPAPDPGPQKITSILFKKLCDRIAGGDQSAYNKAVAVYKLTSEQIAQLKALLTPVPPPEIKPTETSTPGDKLPGAPANIAPPVLTEISNYLFKKLCDRVRSGDIVAFNKAVNTYKFESVQWMTINEILETVNKPNLEK